MGKHILSMVATYEGICSLKKHHYSSYNINLDSVSKKKSYYVASLVFPFSTLWSATPNSKMHNPDDENYFFFVQTPQLLWYYPLTYLNWQD